METIQIPNDATYSPIALTDLAMAAPLLSGLLLGATLPGQAIQAISLSAWAGSAIQDWFQRLGVRRIDFLREFGAAVQRLRSMPQETRQHEVRVLASRVNDGYTESKSGLRELAVRVDRHLTRYIAGITGQRVETSVEVRTFSFIQFVFPFALGAADMISGDIAIFHDSGVLQPHVVAHEFAHRKGYWRELDAQALAYLSLVESGEPDLVQAALCERLHRSLHVLAHQKQEPWEAAVRGLGLRAELEPAFLGLHAGAATQAPGFEDIMRNLYDARMRLTGQNGISDYDLGFTNFLYSFETSDTAHRRPSERGSVHV
jgi:hypothetical protein